MTLLQQVTYRQPATLDVVDRNRTELRLVPRPIQDHDGNAPPAQLVHPLVHPPDRGDQHSAYALLSEQEQLRVLPSRVLRAVPDLDVVAVLVNARFGAEDEIGEEGI